jgi:energy-converting hydrogenase Eha subunit A
MTSELRKAIVSIAMIVTMAVSLIITLPIAQKWTQPRAQEAARSAKPTEIVTAVVHKALIPQLAVVFGCISLSVVVGFVVAKKLPPADPPAKRSRRR